MCLALRTLLILRTERWQPVASVTKKAREWLKCLYLLWFNQVVGAGLGADLPGCVNVFVPEPLLALESVLVSWLITPTPMTCMWLQEKASQAAALLLVWMLFYSLVFKNKYGI